jgi:hypothetical protein
MQDAVGHRSIKLPMNMPLHKRLTEAMAWCALKVFAPNAALT